MNASQVLYLIALISPPVVFGTVATYCLVRGRRQGKPWGESTVVSIGTAFVTSFVSYLVLLLVWFGVSIIVG